MKQIKIAPSLMCADFLNLKEELNLFAEMGLDYLHIDIMDGHYVPNLTLGPDFCRAIRSYSEIPLDIHLMIENVDRYISVFAFAGAVLCIHPEVSYHPIRTLQLIRDKGVRPGIALDPALPVDCIKPMLPYVELICVMTVNPGYTGQKLIPATLDKITGLRRLIDREKLSIELEVDGNVSWENIPRMVKAGAEVLVAGTSSIFDTSGSRRDNIQRLQSLLSALVRET